MQIALSSFHTRALLLTLLLAAWDGTALSAATATETALQVTSKSATVTSVTAGTTATLTASVNAGTKPVTTGQINFCDATAAQCTDSALIGTAQLTKTGKAAYSYVSGLGSHSIKAVFAGTSTDAASSSEASTLDVVLPTGTGHYPTTTMIAASGTGGIFNLTASVAGLNGKLLPTGAVSFFDTSDGNSLLGTAKLEDAKTNFSLFNSSNPPTTATAYGVAVADFNGDGKLDIAVSGAHDTLAVLLGNGDGTFGAPTLYPTDYDPQQVAVADFNGDGFPDIAVADYDGGINIFLGNGNGTFTAAPEVGDATDTIAIADFNGDGIPDLAAPDADNTLQIWLGVGDGTFAQPQGNYAPPSTGNSPFAIAAADFNGDGIVDLAVTNGTDNTVSILLGQGDGNFTTLAAAPATGLSPDGIATGDFNGDGLPYLAIANVGTNTATILLNQGDGNFKAAPDLVVGSSAGETRAVVTGDFNGDGHLDLAIADLEDGETIVFLGNGTGKFVAGATAPTFVPEFIGVGDFNGDGLPDLAIPDTAFGTTAILLSQFVQTVALSDVKLPEGGSQQVEAIYGGDSAFAASTSSKISLTSPQTVATPAFSPVAGTYTTAQSVKITSATAGATIYYTTNGTAPTTASTKYTAAIAVAASETITSIAVASGFTTSAVASAAYVIEKPAATPVFSVSPGTYESVQTVAISDATSGAAIYYTTNGTAPTTASTKYTAPIAVSATEKIDAIAVAAGYTDSAFASAAYTLVGSPSALSAPATAIATPNATLNAVVNTLGLAGSYVFHFGTSSTALTGSTAATALAASTAPVPVSAELTTLAAKTTYYFQVVVNTAGGTSSGSILSFKTD
jgi:WD40 repeat protein